MQIWLGYVFALVGLIMVILGVLSWLKIIDTERERAAGPWDFLIELLKRAPWVVAVGLVLIYVGLKMIGVQLPP